MEKGQIHQIKIEKQEIATDLENVLEIWRERNCYHCHHLRGEIWFS
jgi:transcription initiation factor IIE alpha subunit